ncbi:MAG TPA: hypothetical protein EYQ31_17475, partial [Candidatus Handelsmanbacteria bacterium]|nr:hypothetical protein [Candidatus Handelsmanbacteria bacterium]
MGIVDDLGTEVVLSAAPQRIVSLAPSNTELLFAMGLGDRVVGVTKYCNYPPAAEAIEQVAGFSDLSVEKIAAVRPDLVVASRGNDAEGLETVRQMGVPVFALANNSIADVIESVRRLGQLTGRQQAGERLATSLQARIDTVTTRVAPRLLAAQSDDKRHGRPRVLWGFAGDPIYTAGAGSIIDTALLTNMEAAAEIARQIRLRNMGGMIVIDFIHMDEDAHWEQVLAALEDGLADDRTHSRIIGLTGAGLVELTRRRRRESLVQALTDPCMTCAGTGRIPSPETVVYDIMRSLRREAR